MSTLLHHLRGMTLLDIGSYWKFFFLILCLNHKLPDKIVYKIIITFETFQTSKYIQTYPAVKLEELGEVTTDWPEDTRFSLQPHITIGPETDMT